MLRRELCELVREGPRRLAHGRRSARHRCSRTRRRAPRVVDAEAAVDGARLDDREVPESQSRAFESEVRLDRRAGASVPTRTRYVPGSRLPPSSERVGGRCGPGRCRRAWRRGRGPGRARRRSPSSCVTAYTPPPTSDDRKGGPDGPRPVATALAGLSPADQLVHVGSGCVLHDFLLGEMARRSAPRREGACRCGAVGPAWRYSPVTKVIESRAWAIRRTRSAEAPCWCHVSTTIGRLPAPSPRSP